MTRKREAIREDERRGARRSQADRSRATRDAVVTAAIRTIAELGYAEATTTKIAARANVTRGARQHHFQSRDDLIGAVIDKALEELNYPADVDHLSLLPVAARVDAVVENYRRVFGGDFFIAALNIWLGVGRNAIARVQRYAGLEGLSSFQFAGPSGFPASLTRPPRQVHR